MCLSVYLESSCPLPLVAWSADDPGFHVEELSKRDEQVRQRFTQPNVYYVGSHEGCGCGFYKEGLEEDELADVEESYSRFADYLKKEKLIGAQLQIFACWEGGEIFEPEASARIGFDTLLVEQFEFSEGSLYEIV